MERLKSKTTLLVALVLTAVLAMAGVGYALANPNDGSDSNVESTIETPETLNQENSKYTVIDSSCGRSDLVDMSYSLNGSVLTIEYSKTSECRGVEELTDPWISYNGEEIYFDYETTTFETEYTDTGFLWRVDLGQFDIPSGETFEVHRDVYAYPLGDSSGRLCFTSLTIAVNNNLSENQSNIVFDFNFKATGIQSTGFNDYHEAFAALNN